MRNSGSSRGRWQRVVEARRQARIAQGKDPDQSDLFTGPPKRKSTPYVPVDPQESQPHQEKTEYVLTLGEAAARLGVSRRELEAMIAADKIVAQPMGLTLAIPTSEIRRIIRPREV